MWTDPITQAEWQAIVLSFHVAFWATLYGLPLALAVAFVLDRGRFWGRGLLSMLVYLPLVLPPVVTGYMLLVGFGPQGPLGQVLAIIGLRLPFTAAGAVLVTAVMAFPLMVRSIQVSLSHMDRGLEQAAATLGARPLRVFCMVTFPLIWPGIVAGAALGFAKAMGEFGATITFVSNIPGQTQTIPSAIYALLQVPGQEGAVLRLIVLSSVLSLGALALSEYMVRRT
ncbi:MAG: molybdate ABC transporter permease subunit [Pseudomonadota bacterium]